MFRTRVLYLWLHMLGAFLLLLFLLTLVLVGGSVLLSDSDECKTLAMLVLLPFPLALGGCFVAIFGSFLMLPLLQGLLVRVGNRCGRPADFRVFRRTLAWHSLVPATLPLLLLLLPQVRQTPWPALALALGAWAAATVAVWRWYACRLYAEWQAGVAH